ncbi:hypothetical protein [Bizionia arctica]|uniref:Uncharacterized protein n=1 Tax=Bizionia arctica TaxID=1495645 RepID=A0A917GYJ8_9FLAO|nr:hypothetical protein [Bizionia arctica]GGG60582.1 hypothetical protein GCM10010976_34180 [Bizionia arctica]
MNLKQIVKYGVLIFGAIILIGFVLKGNISHEQFDSEKWKNWTELENDYLLRWNMMNSLQSAYELKGKTKTEIIELLGYPEFETIGNSIGFCLDSPHFEKCEKQLIFQFDETNTIIDLKVYDMDQ